MVSKISYKCSLRKGLTHVNLQKKKQKIEKNEREIRCKSWHLFFLR